MDPSIAQFRNQPNFKATALSYHFSLSPHLNHLMITLHPAWIPILYQTSLYILLFHNLITQISRPRRTWQLRTQPIYIFPTPFSTPPLPNRKWTCFKPLLYLQRDTHIFPLNQWTLWQQQLYRHTNISRTRQFHHFSATITAPSNANYSSTLIIQTPTPPSDYTLPPTQLTRQIHPRLVQTEPIEPSKKSPIIHLPLTQEQPEHMLITQTTLKNSLKYVYHFSPIHLFFSEPNDEHPNYYDEHVLYPKLSWTSFYHFSNPLSLPLYNTQHDNEQCKNELYRLTTALTPKQFTRIGYKQWLFTFTASKANECSIHHYDHHIIRPNENHFWTTINLLTLN